MKKLIILFAVCLLLVGGTYITVSAETSPTLNESYTLNVDENGMIEIPAVESGAAGEEYLVSIFRTSDLAHPLYEDVAVGKFKMGYTGSFTFIYELVGGTPEDSLMTSVTVKDSIAPVLNISGLEETYFVGDTTSFKVEYSDNMDSGEKLIYTLRVWYEDAPYTAAVQENGQVLFDVKGDYRLVFTVRDSSDNTVVQEFSYKVAVNGFDYSMLIPVLAVAIMLAMFIGPIIFVVKSEFRPVKKEKKK